MPSRLAALGSADAGTAGVRRERHHRRPPMESAYHVNLPISGGSTVQQSGSTRAPRAGQSGIAMVPIDPVTMWWSPDGVQYARRPGRPARRGGDPRSHGLHRGPPGPGMSTADLASWAGISDLDVLRRIALAGPDPDPMTRLFTGLRGGRITRAIPRDATRWDEVVAAQGYEFPLRHGSRPAGLTWMADAGDPYTCAPRTNLTKRRLASLSGNPPASVCRVVQWLALRRQTLICRRARRRTRQTGVPTHGPNCGRGRPADVVVRGQRRPGMWVVTGGSCLPRPRPSSAWPSRAAHWLPRSR
ncbi:hypothetical protein [Embleya sp. NPDC050493]|uniref:AraC-like ligand-binding domain-containing protein n=1 Tax=Embleya sp. NPDC050493 TaxID=3363989 RepID=UPI0037BC9ED2